MRRIRTSKYIAVQIQPRKHAPDHADHTLVPPGNARQIIQINNMSVLKGLYHGVGIDHTDHTDHLSGVWTLSPYPTPALFPRFGCFLGFFFVTFFLFFFFSFFFRSCGARSGLLQASSFMLSARGSNWTRRRPSSSLSTTPSRRPVSPAVFRHCFIHKVAGSCYREA